MKSGSIVDGKLFIRHDLNNSIRINTLFQNNTNNKAHLANQLLLHESILIPTKDFGIIPILIDWMGLNTFIDAIENNTLSFLHQKYLLGYSSDGITEYYLRETKLRKFLWWQQALFKGMEIAIDLQLSNHFPSIPKKERTNISKKIISKSVEIEYNHEFFVKNIVEKTYSDIQNNENLFSQIAKYANLPQKEIDLTKLGNINQNQLQTLRINNKPDPVNLILNVAEINMMILMSTLSGKSDLTIFYGAEQILKSKLIRAGIHSNFLEGFSTLLELNEIPSIGEAVTNNTISFVDIWKIRRKKVSRKFRKWLREVEPKDARELEKLYVKSLGNKSIVDSLPAKIIRFVITSAASAINPGLGLVVGTTDNFFTSKWLEGFSPKLFIDELNKIKINH